MSSAGFETSLFLSNGMAFRRPQIIRNQLVANNRMFVIHNS